MKTICVAILTGMLAACASGQPAMTDAEPLVFRNSPLVTVVKALGGKVEAHRIVLSPGAEGYRMSGILNRNDAPLLMTILRNRADLKITDTIDEVRVELRREFIPNPNYPEHIPNYPPDNTGLILQWQKAREQRASK